jgi:asparagine synthase (glutamine-hydrolysing)
MAHSLEIRVPLVDVGLLCRVAPMLVSANPPTKRDMADAPVKKLPPEILNRVKTGFHVPVRDWLMQRGGQPPERGLRSWAKHVFERFTKS